MKEFLGFGGYQRIPEGKYTWQHLTFVLSLIAIMIALAVNRYFKQQKGSQDQKQGLDRCGDHDQLDRNI